MMFSVPPLGNPNVDHAIPIKSRKPKTLLATLVRYTLVFIVFGTGSICINATQFLLLPLKFFTPTRALHTHGMRYTKAAAAILFMITTQLFAPTSIHLTYDSSSLGRNDIPDWIVRDPKTGQVKSLNWPKKLVIISNHQMYADWWYIWLLGYFARVHAYILIVLKKSLKWAPVLGWAMQFFKFIFLERSWAADRLNLTSRLSAIAAHHMTTTTERAEEDEPLALIIFPEGTLVSGLTLPVSQKYAEKMGLKHPQHMLLPRSTGLHTTLLSLSQLPSLYLMDVTVGYPGIPRNGYGQDYYTLKSIFFDGIPPPEIHYHVRLYNVQKDVPLYAPSTSSIPQAIKDDPSLSLEQRRVLAQSMAKKPHLLEPGEEDKKAFDTWLRERWYEKDELMEKWHQGGQKKLGTGSEGEQEVVVPLELRTIGEVMDAFCWFAPALAGYIFSNFFWGSAKVKTG